MTAWEGTNRKTTPIGGPPGVSYYQQNTRMHVDQEIQRRLGMAASSLPSAGAGIIGIATAFTANGPIIVTLTPSTVIGDVDPLPKWRERYLVPPVGATCAIWGPFVASGNFSGGAGTFTLPAALSCAGTLTFTVVDTNGGGGYGMSCGATGGACLPNGSQSVAIAAGTTSIGWGVSGGCNFGPSSPTNPTWTLTATQP